MVSSRHCMNRCLSQAGQQLRVGRTPMARGPRRPTSIQQRGVLLAIMLLAVVCMLGCGGDGGEVAETRGQSVEETAAAALAQTPTSRLMPSPTATLIPTPTSPPAATPTPLPTPVSHPPITIDNAESVGELDVFQVGDELPSYRHVAFSSDGTLLAFVSGHVWELESGEELAVLQTNSPRVAWSPIGTRLAYGSVDGTVKLWDAGTQQNFLVLEGHAKPVVPVAWSPDGSMLASGSQDGTVRLWHPETGEQAAELGSAEQVASAVQRLAWSPKGELLAVGRDEGHVELWEVETGKKRITLEGNARYTPLGIAWSLDSAFTAAWNTLAHGFVWNAETGTEVYFNYHVDDVAWSPAEVELALGTGSLIIWNAGTGEVSAELKGHSDLLSSVAWSPDGLLLASASRDGTVRLWDAETGQQLNVLQGHSAWVQSVSWSPDGVLLASGSKDGTVRLWGVRED
jgi:WD40 repeat protein